MKLFSVLKNTPNSIWLIVFIAFVLRILWLPENMFFGFEQGRDLFAVQELLKLQDIKLIGPNTDIIGIYHGALWYYILAFLSLISFKDPFLMVVFMILANVLAIPYLYKAVDTLSDKKTALISCLVYALSYSSIIYSRWLSNPNLIAPIVILIFYFLVESRTKPIKLAIVAALWFIMFHLSLASASVVFLPILAFVFIYKIPVKMKTVLLTGLFAIAIFSPYLVFEIKHDFLLSNNLHKLFELMGGPKEIKTLDPFLNEVVANTIPSNRAAGLFLFVITILTTTIFALKNKFARASLAFLIAPPLLFFLFGIYPLRHIFIITPIFFSICLTLTFLQISKLKLKYLANAFLGFVIISNLWEIAILLPSNKNNFLQHEQRTYLGDEKRLLDYIYKDADGKAFSYDYYSVPYWQSEGWAYLFLWYGQSKYGYLPEANRTDVFYVVMEPDEKQQVYQKNWYKELSRDTILVDMYVSGKLIAEKRQRK